MTTTLDIAATPQHIVLSGMSWSYYEHTLEEIGNRRFKVAFLDGTIEIKSPLPKHNKAKNAFGDFIAAIAEEFRIPRSSYGSTTFRRQDKGAGTEPDECFYFYDIESVKDIERFDPSIHRAPDLAIEIDIWSPSLPREPIYARLGVPEIWRFNGQSLIVRVLTPERTYIDSTTSRALPFLPLVTFVIFIKRMMREDESAVLAEFRTWARNLAQSKST